MNSQRKNSLVPQKERSVWGSSDIRMRCGPWEHITNPLDGGFFNLVISDNYTELLINTTHDENAYV